MVLLVVMMRPSWILVAAVVVVFGGINETGGHEDGNGHTKDPEEDVHSDLQRGGLVVLLGVETAISTANIGRLAATQRVVVVTTVRTEGRPAVRVVPAIVVPERNVGQDLAQVGHVHALHAAHPVIVVVVVVVVVVVIIVVVVARVNAVAVVPTRLPLPLLPVPLTATAVAVMAILIDLEHIVVVVVVDVVALPLCVVEVDVHVNGSNGEGLHLLVVAIVG